ncbi:hypothetical protein B0H14DRAFT_3489438 [Mycena olivaceomarginata]|nr:hypothetical protein B0H14DRAFT_3489438 [Mycena olivaceomarginata]
MCYGAASVQSSPPLTPTFTMTAGGSGGGWGPDPTGWGQWRRMGSQSDGLEQWHWLGSGGRSVRISFASRSPSLILFARTPADLPPANAPPARLHLDGLVGSAWVATWTGEAVETTWHDVQTVERAWLDAKPITWVELGSRTPDLDDIKAAWEAFFRLRQEQAPDPQPQIPRWDGPRWHLPGDLGCDLPYL